MPCLVHPDVVSGLSTCSRCGRDFCADCVITLNGKVVCASCKGDMVLDIKSGYEEGALTLATPVKRFLSVFIDGIITTIAVYIVVFAVLIPVMLSNVVDGKPHEPPIGIILGLMVFSWLFPITYEALFLSRNGQTLGKMLLKVQVVRPDGERISRGQAWGRSLMRVLLGILIIVDPLFVFSKERATLHDRICKTRVIAVSR